MKRLLLAACIAVAALAGLTFVAAWLERREAYPGGWRESEDGVEPCRAQGFDDSGRLLVCIAPKGHPIGGGVYRLAIPEEE